MTTPDHREFKRGLGLLDSTMIVIGSMIGSGIFLVSADIARSISSPGFLLVVWVITGAITVIAALSYGELAGMMPRAGGQYVYLREAYNPLVGFLYGWTLFLIIQTGTIAAVAVAFAKFTAVLLPWFSETNILISLIGIDVSAAQVLAILSIALLTFINLQGLREGKIVQNLFTITKTAALFGLIVLGISLAQDPEVIKRNLEIFWQAQGAEGTPFAGPISGLAVLAVIGTSMVGSLFSSDAWNNITFTAGEVINPKRNIPLSLALGTGTVALLYILANVAYLMILPLTGDPNATDALGRGIQYATGDRVGVAAASQLFGESAAVITAIFLMISTFGCNNGLILAGARVSYAMALDGLFFTKAGGLNAHSVPGWALVAQAIWASLLCLSGTYGDLLDYVVFAVLIFYVLTVAGIFILRRKRPDVERPYKAWGYPFIPGLYIVIASAISIDLLIFKPQYTWPGLIIVLLGIPVYLAWAKKSKLREG